MDNVFIEEYLKQHVIPKVPQKNINLSKLDAFAVEVSIICCFHDESQPSLRLYKKRAQDHFDDWYCFGSCHTGGGIVELHKHTMLTFYNKNLSYIQALESLADMYRIKYDDLYFDPKETTSKIKSTGITQEEILDYLVNEKYTKLAEQQEYYGKYVQLLESTLYKIKSHNFEDYIKGVTEVDYLFSLGISNSELCIELDSLLRQLQANLTQYTSDSSLCQILV